MVWGFSALPPQVGLEKASFFKELLEHGALVEYLLFLFRAEFAFVFGCKWAKRVLWFVGDMVVAEDDGLLLVICEL